MESPHSGESAGGHSGTTDKPSIPHLRSRLDAAGKGVGQHRTAQVLQTAALRDNRTRRNAQAEHSKHAHLRAQEHYLEAINWYRRQIEERECFEGICRAA